MTRLLTIMGSGETAPTMVKAHRAVVERLGRGAKGVLLDTPFGFQMNADELSSRAVEYFRESVGAELEVAGLRSAADLQGASGDAVLSRVTAAEFVFAGPGSPTYALRNWNGTLVPGLLAEKLAHGGAVTFASAAALTLGLATVPVYEIYKVGEEPRWEDGLDLLGPLGLRVAVIPHFDNAEGGTHDTRYCYLGEERLALLERSLPDGAFVLGVDEHTALFLDFESSTASVFGRGVVTVRSKGHMTQLQAGDEVPIGRLADMAAELSASAGGGSVEPSGGVAAKGVGDEPSVAFVPTTTPAGSPLLEAIRDHEDRFRSARSAGDAATMLEITLSLEEQLWAWRADTLQSDEADRGRAALRSMVHDLGNLATAGARSPAELFAPYVEALLSVREGARRDKRFADADDVRDRLIALGVELHDTPAGTTWDMPGRDGAGQ